MSKSTTVFIATLVYLVSLAVGGTSSWGMGLNDKNQESAAYKAALSFLIITSITMFTSVILIAYHATKLYCR